jgi:hypothetical protein
LCLPKLRAGRVVNHVLLIAAADSTAAEADKASGQRSDGKQQQQGEAAIHEFGRSGSVAVLRSANAARIRALISGFSRSIYSRISRYLADSSGVR